MQMPRFIPPKAVKVADKQSDAIAYLYSTPKGRPAACVYFGDQRKPVSHFSYRSADQRTKEVTSLFEARRARTAAKAATTAERKAFKTSLVIGDILSTCWGYDQTNREFFEVIAVKANTATVREIAQERKYTGDMIGFTVPMAGQYIGEPITKRVLPGERIKFASYRYASKWNTGNIAGISIGQPLSFSEYG